MRRAWPPTARQGRPRHAGLVPRRQSGPAADPDATVPTPDAAGIMVLRLPANAPAVIPKKVGAFHLTAGLFCYRYVPSVDMTRRGRTE